MNWITNKKSHLTHHFRKLEIKRWEWLLLRFSWISMISNINILIFFSFDNRLNWFTSQFFLPFLYLWCLHFIWSFTREMTRETFYLYKQISTCRDIVSMWKLFFAKAHAFLLLRKSNFPTSITNFSRMNLHKSENTIWVFHVYTLLLP